MNIPVYRAKKIDSDEHVVGAFHHRVTRNENYIYTDDSGVYEIDQSTLAIHFEDMLDSQGNKIFASLSEDGKGGDIMKDDEYYGIAKYKDSRFVVEYENVEECLCEGNFEIVGIQE